MRKKKKKLAVSSDFYGFLYCKTIFTPQCLCYDCTVHTITFRKEASHMPLFAVKCLCVYHSKKPVEFELDSKFFADAS